jgi:hypothetical protein
MKNPHVTLTKGLLLLSILALLALSPAHVIFAQTSTTVSVEPSTQKPAVGDTLTVNIVISNVQNLYAVDISVSWNPSALTILTHTPQLGVESYPNGVLHEPLDIVEDNATQEAGVYTLTATSTGADTASFSGSGTLATLTFNVTSTGSSTIGLSSELADKPESGSNANFIDHTDNGSPIDVAVPEFPTLAALILLVVVATGALVFSKKHMKKN